MAGAGAMTGGYYDFLHSPNTAAAMSQQSAMAYSGSGGAMSMGVGGGVGGGSGGHPLYHHHHHHQSAYDTSQMMMSGMGAPPHHSHPHHHHHHAAMQQHMQAAAAAANCSNYAPSLPTINSTISSAINNRYAQSCAMAAAGIANGATGGDFTSHLATATATASAAIHNGVYDRDTASTTPSSSAASSSSSAMYASSAASMMGMGMGGQWSAGAHVTQSAGRYCKQQPLSPTGSTGSLQSMSPPSSSDASPYTGLTSATGGEPVDLALAEGVCQSSPDVCKDEWRWMRYPLVQCGLARQPTQDEKHRPENKTVPMGLTRHLADYVLPTLVARGRTCNCANPGERFPHQRRAHQQQPPRGPPSLQRLAMAVPYWGPECKTFTSLHA
ncbi:hypothetical protein C0Q70_18786 [Pomacea canaliculata]|uniref:Uncharacterized protein n=1 Tax=Pomacea canaliculata TaxID=400727 RepID=A0A2T7NHK3_POMCA|nr:hypothetical protein C0Q70_18786 [Pomacea canaliculata]